MDYEISSYTLSSALGEIENLNEIEEDIQEVRISTRKEFLQKRRDTTFERELNEVLKYLKNLKMLIINNSSKDEKDKFDIDINSGISKQLETLRLKGINLGTADLDRFFREHPYINNLALNDCNISNIDFLKSVPDGVTGISLGKNPISAEFADDILRLRQERFKILDIRGCEEVLAEFEKRGFEFSELLTEHRGKLDGNQFYEAFQKALSSKEYSVRDMQQLSQYIDFFSEKRMQEQRTVHIDSLEEYDEQYIESINLFGSGENVTVVVTPKIAEQLKGKISKDINVQIAIKNASELSVEQLEELQKSYNLKDIKVDDPNQSLNRQQTTPYDIETYKRCRETIDSLLDGIDLSENPNDVNRDKRIYGEVIKRLANHMSYDYESLKLEDKEEEDIIEQINQEIDAEEGLNAFQKSYKRIALLQKYRMERVSEVSKNCRNMQGGLLNNTCVCAGYAEIVRNVFSCCGIEARYIWGYNTINRESCSHAWNQIKLDGKWYNMDLTWDRDRIVKGEETKYSLQSDKDFNTQKHPYYAEECKQEKCSETLPVNEVTQIIYGQTPKQELQDSNIEQRTSETPEIKYYLPGKVREETGLVANIPDEHKKKGLLKEIESTITETDIGKSYGILSKTKAERENRVASVEMEDTYENR